MKIEALAIHFTAGVAAGALLLRLPASPYILSGSLLLVLASLVLVVLKAEQPRLLFPTFLLLGAFCTLADAFPGPDGETFLERWASTLGKRMRAFIDGTPFPSEGTAPLLKAFLTGDRSGSRARRCRYSARAEDRTCWPYRDFISASCTCSCRNSSGRSGTVPSPGGSATSSRSCRQAFSPS